MEEGRSPCYHVQAHEEVSSEESYLPGPDLLAHGQGRRAHQHRHWGGVMGIARENVGTTHHIDTC